MTICVFNTPWVYLSMYDKKLAQFCGADLGRRRGQGNATNLRLKRSSRQPSSNERAFTKLRPSGHYHVNPELKYSYYRNTAKIVKCYLLAQINITKSPLDYTSINLPASQIFNIFAPLRNQYAHTKHSN